MYIKKILILVLIIVSTINYSYSDYTLSTKDKKTVNNAVTVINKFIDKKGEKYIDIIVKKINLILKRKDLSERILTVFEELKKGISLTQSNEEESNKENNEEELNSDETESNEESQGEEDDSNTEENQNSESKTEGNSENDSEDNPEYNETSYELNTVREYWLELMNSARQDESLENYSYDKSLDETAQKWAELALEKGEIDHKVDPTDSYYDYSKKKSWMNENGVLCENVNGITFSESIAWGEFICKEDDCTIGVKAVMKKAFDAYMAEKGQIYDAHYKAIVQPEFLKMGLGLGIQDRGNNKYALFLTNHYCTENIK